MISHFVLQKLRRDERYGWYGMLSTINFVECMCALCRDGLNYPDVLIAEQLSEACGQGAKKEKKRKERIGKRKVWSIVNIFRFWTKIRVSLMRLGRGEAYIGAHFSRGYMLCHKLFLKVSIKVLRFCNSDRKIKFHSLIKFHENLKIKYMRQ